jgi:hypothetical protein
MTVEVTGVTGSYLIKTGTWTAYADGSITASGPAKLCLVMECGTVEVKVDDGESVTVKIVGTTAYITSP